MRGFKNQLYIELGDEHGTYTNMATGTIDCEITVLRFQSFGAQNQVDTLPEISQHLIVSTKKKNAIEEIGLKGFLDPEYLKRIGS